MELLNYALILAGIVLAIKVIIFGIGWVRLMKSPVRLQTSRWADEREVPAELLPVFQQADAQLAALGFHVCYTAVTDDSIPYYYRVYTHPYTHAFAEAGPAIEPGWVRSFDVSFSSLLSDGRVLETTDCRLHLLPPMPPRFIMQDNYLANVEQQWQAHLHALQGLPASARPARCEPGDHLNYGQLFRQEAMAHRARTGIIKATGSSSLWQYTPVGAFKIVKQVLSANKRVTEAVKRAKTMPQAATITSADQSAQVSADIAAFERLLEEENKQTWGWLGKSALFILSVLVFAVSFGLSFSWKTLIILMGVLFFHELGHLFGMIIFGYRDRQILFVPLLGAVTIGKKEDATPMQRLIIYLLGPVPGVVVGYVALYLYYQTSARIWFDIGILAIILNYINLLPILPLDGGRVVETLFFTRFPRAQLVFMLLSAAAMAIASFALDTKILLFLAISYVLSIPAQWRFGTAAKMVQKQLPRQSDRKERLRAIFHTLMQPQLSTMSMADRVQMAKNLLNHFTPSLPGIGTIVIGLMLYFASLSLPVTLPIVYIIGSAGNAEGLLRMAAMLRGVGGKEVAEPNWQEQLDKAQSPDARWQIYINAGDWHMDMESSDKAREYYQQALNIANGFERQDMRYVDTLLLLAETLDNSAEIKSHYQRALERVQEIHNEDHPRIADILERMVYLYEGDNEKPEQLKMLNRVLAIRAKNGQEKCVENARTLLQIAQLHETAGQLDSAHDHLQRALEIYAELPEEEHNNSYYVIQLMTELKVKRDGNDAAAQFLAEQITQMAADNKKSRGLPELSTHLGWLHIERDDNGAAYNAFTGALNSLSEIYGDERLSNYVAVTTLLDLSYLELRQGRHAEAQAYFDKAKQSYEKPGFASFDDYCNNLTKSNEQNEQNAEIVNQSPAWQQRRHRAHIEVVQRLKH